MIAKKDNPSGLVEADIVVGIPSRNEAESIAGPTRQVDKGLTKHFSGYSAMIVNCDNDSPDNTHQAFMDTDTKNPKMYVSTPPGETGKGANLRNLFEVSVELSAKAVVIVDADLVSITPQWVRNLGEPLLDQADFVTPLYVRHKYDRLVNSSVAYPLTRALYGRRVRQPIGGEFGVSGALAKRFLDSDDWIDEASHFGIDVWMTTLAMLDRVRVIQSFMGKPKVHRVTDSETQPGAVFRDLLTTIFELMKRFDGFWTGVKWSRPTAVFGFGTELDLPSPPYVDEDRLWENFLNPIGGFWDLYREIMPDETFGKAQEVASLQRDRFEFPIALWTKVLYDFAVAYKNNTATKDDLLDALLPLYYGRTLSFVRETEAMNTQQVEEIIEDQCVQFEKTKPYLLERWFSG